MCTKWENNALRPTTDFTFFWSHAGLSITQKLRQCPCYPLKETKILCFLLVFLAATASFWPILSIPPPPLVASTSRRELKSKCPKRRLRRYKVEGGPSSVYRHSKSPNTPTDRPTDRRGSEHRRSCWKMEWGRRSVGKGREREGRPWRGGRRSANKLVVKQGREGPREEKQATPATSEIRGRIRQ